MNTSNHEMIIYGRHTSYNVQKVLWLADELDLDYVHKEVGGRFGENKTKHFLSLNPSGKVPVLTDDEKVFWESNTILRYLADSYGNNLWISSDAYERSKTDRLMDWSIDQFEKAFVGVFWGHYRTPPDKRNNAAIANSVIQCEACLALLGTHLAGNKYLVGNYPTVADVAIGVFMHRLTTIDLNIAMPENIRIWHERLCNSPSYTKWVKSDFTELKGRSDY